MLRPGWAGERLGSDVVVADEGPADDHLLDLRGALADEQQRRVPVEPLDLVLGRVAVAAVDTQAVLDNLLAVLGGEILGHASLDGGPPARLLATRRHDHQLMSCYYLGGHLGELE